MAVGCVRYSSTRTRELDRNMIDSFHFPKVMHHSQRLPSLAASGCLNFNFFGVPCTLFLSLAHELPYCFRHPSLSQYRTSFMETFICFAGSELIPYFVVQKPLAARRFPSCLIIVSKTSSSVSYCCTALVLNEVANERCHEVE